MERRDRPRSVTQVAVRCRLRHQARVTKIEKDQEKVYELRYGVEPIRLPGRTERVRLVVVAGFGEEPMMLLIHLRLQAHLALDKSGTWRASADLVYSAWLFASPVDAADPRLTTVVCTEAR